jgi:cytidylate kinase
MAVVTISASYGCGGRVVGVEVVRRLGLPFFDQELVSALAGRLGLSASEVAAHERCPAGFFWHMRFAGVPWAGPYPFGPLDEDAAYRAAADSTIRELAGAGGVIFGRGAAIVLKDHPGALHVRLDGPVALRTRQAAELGGLDLRAAHHRQRHVDHVRHAYVRRYYHVDISDRRHFDLVIDATGLPLATCVEVVVAGARHLQEASRAGLSAHWLRRAG